jgi:hypothetical protein
MDSMSKSRPSRERAAALIIVLAFVVLLTAVSLAYLSRTTGDRPVAHSSFNQSKVDGIAASAMDIVIGDLQQEITNGSTATTQADGTTLYTPTAAADMVPQRSGTVAGVPNLIRRSVRSDPMPAPGVGSRASAVNSTTDSSLNGRSITAASWNRHYLVPKKTTGTADSIPIDAFANATPDWVYITSTGIAPITQPSNEVVGRYAYAVYDEGGLLDMNVAGYPSGTTSTQAGRKGSVAFADLTALGNYPIHNGEGGSAFQVDRLVGWRNYATTQPSNLFPNTSFASNLNTSGPATLFVNYVTNNTDGFLGTSLPTWQATTNDWRTDQRFVQRQQLLAFQNTKNTNNGNPIANTSQFDVNALQYLSTFSREVNAPSFSPTTPTATNPNFLLRRVTGTFTRFDGTTSVVGEPLVKTRFPLSRLAWITYNGPSALRTLPPQSPALATTDPNYDMWALQWTYGVPASYLQLGTAANIKKCFGLTFAGSPTYAWTYTNPTGGGAVSTIMTLAQVAAASREPDFFELLQAAILSGSLGQNTGGGVTGQNTGGAGLVFPDIHMSSTMHHILKIGAAIIDQASPGSIPTQIQFTGANGNTWTAYGVKNLPYITQLYPIAGISPNDPNPSTPTLWGSYLLFQLWNPHQNATALPVTVRLRVDGAVGIFAGSTWTTGTTPQIITNGTVAGESVTLNSAFSFSAPAPLTNLNTTNAAVAPGPAAGGAFAALTAPTVP